MNEYLSKLGDPAYAVGGVSLLMVFCGLTVVTRLKSSSPFAPYALQILGLTFILPIVLLAAIVVKIDSQAVVGLLGTIVGYIFGTSKGADPSRPQRSEPEESKEPRSDRDDTPRADTPAPGR